MQVNNPDKRVQMCLLKRVITLLILIFSLCFSPHSVSADDIGLIETFSLKQNMSDWIILDARPKKEWMAGHIPGARSFSWEDYTRTDESGVQYRILPPQKLASALGAMGINEHSAIVIYGDADTSWGGEGWACWALTWLGHKGPIRLLSGGIQKWQNCKLPVSKEMHNKIKPSQYSYNLDRYVTISTSDLRKQREDFVLIDTRSTLEWLRGHIPGAIRINWKDFYSKREDRPLSSEELTSLLKRHNVNVQKQVVYYCTGGIRSGYAWFVHKLSGLSPAINYEGGIEAWQRLPAD